MKKERQALIRSLIADDQISTQEELVGLLTKSGYHVTQATVSRDIRDLHLIKSVAENGRSYYAMPQGDEAAQQEDIPHYLVVLRESFISAQCAGNLLVIKTAVGMAMAFAAALDSLHIQEIIGSIAGDDTIFVAVADEEGCRKLREKVLSLIQKD